MGTMYFGDTELGGKLPADWWMVIDLASGSTTYLCTYPSSRPDLPGNRVSLSRQQ